MGGALIRGIISNGLAQANQITVVDPVQEKLDEFQAELSVKTSLDAASVLNAADIIVLAVKPHILPLVLDEVRSEVRPDQLYISIIAGVDSNFIQGRLGQENSVIRVMPNIAATVGASASALAGIATNEQFDFVQKMFESVGEVVRVEEHLIDSVTGLSGSGSAYVFTVIEAMADGGLLMGLPRPVALKLAAQTVFGAAKMMLESGEHPALLRDRVTTPGGTTIAGLHKLEKGKLRNSLIDAVEAATKRAYKLKKKARKGK